MLSTCVVEVRCRRRRSRRSVPLDRRRQRGHDRGVARAPDEPRPHDHGLEAVARSPLAPPARPSPSWRIERLRVGPQRGVLVHVHERLPRRAAPPRCRRARTAARRPRGRLPGRSSCRSRCRARTPRACPTRRGARRRERRTRQPPAPAPIASRSERSPFTGSAPSAPTFCAEASDRASARTCQPSPTRRRIRRPPMNPDPPVTNRGRRSPGRLPAGEPARPVDARSPTPTSITNAAKRPQDPVSRPDGQRAEHYPSPPGRLTLRASARPCPSTTNVTELPDSRVRLDAEVPSDELESRVQRAATAIGRELRIPGFRKGKVPGADGDPADGPRGRARAGGARLPARVVRGGADALRRVDRRRPQARPRRTCPAAGEPLSFSIEVGVTPKATLGDYKGLEVGRREPEVPAEAVDHELDHLREPLRPRRERRPARRRGRPRGRRLRRPHRRRALRGRRGPRLHARARRRPAGRGLRGAAGGRARPASTRTVEVDFPDDYHAEDLAGQATRSFDVDVKDVQPEGAARRSTTTSPPRRVTSTPLEELRADIEHKLEHAQEHSIEDEFREAVVDAAVDEAKVDLPDDLVAARAEEMWDRTARALQHQGLDPDTYLQATGKTREEMIEETQRGRRAPARAARACSRRSRTRRASRSPTRSCSRRSAARPSARASSRRSCWSASSATGRDLPLRRDLRLRKAVDLMAEQRPGDRSGQGQGARARSGRRTSSARTRAPRSSGLPASAKPEAPPRS